MSEYIGNIHVSRVRKKMKSYDIDVLYLRDLFTIR